MKVQEYKVAFGTWMADERPETRRIGDHQYRTLFSESILPGVRKLGLGEAEMGELKEECRHTFRGRKGSIGCFMLRWEERSDDLRYTSHPVAKSSHCTSLHRYYDFFSIRNVMIRTR